MTRIMIIFLVALILTICPLPEIVAQIRPPWILLIILYVQFYLPRYFKLLLVFLLGLMLDSLLATVIGEHAFALCFVTWLASTKTRRFSLFPISQQMMYIGLFAIAYQLVIVLIDSFLGYQAKWLTVLGVGFVSVLIWPWLRLLGEEFLLTGAFSRHRQ